MKKVVLLGDLNLDIIVRPDRIGEKAIVQQLSTLLGGQAANQAMAAQKLGADVRLHAKIGDDLFGVLLEGMLEKQGLGGNRVFKGSGIRSGTAILFIDEQGNSPVSCAVKGGHAHITSQEVDSIELDGSEVVVAELLVQEDALARFMKRAKDKGCTVILNCSPIAKPMDGLFGIPDYLVMNEFEFSYFANGAAKDGMSKDDVRKLSGKIVHDGQTLIVTLGKDGAVAVNGQQFEDVPGHVVNVANTVGAGDCFLGAFAACLADGKKIGDALRFANAAAALKVQGLPSGMPSSEEVDALLKK